MSRYAWVSHDPMFISLTAAQVREDREWARRHYAKCTNRRDPNFHPVIRDEFAKLEAAERATQHATWRVGVT